MSLRIIDHLRTIFISDIVFTAIFSLLEVEPGQTRLRLVFRSHFSFCFIRWYTKPHVVLMFEPFRVIFLTREIGSRIPLTILQ